MGKKNNAILKYLDNPRRFADVFNGFFGGGEMIIDPRYLREGNEKISEIMSSAEEVSTVHEEDPARKAVILTANNKFVTVPVVNDDNQVIGMVRACDIVELLSDLYDIKVEKLYKAMQNQHGKS